MHQLSLRLLLPERVLHEASLLWVVDDLDLAVAEELHLAFAGQLLELALHPVRHLYLLLHLSHMLLELFKFSQLLLDLRLSRLFLLFVFVDL